MNLEKTGNSRINGKKNENDRTGKNVVSKKPTPRIREYLENREYLDNKEYRENKKYRKTRIA